MTMPMLSSKGLTQMLLNTSKAPSLVMTDDTVVEVTRETEALVK